MNFSFLKNWLYFSALLFSSIVLAQKDFAYFKKELDFSLAKSEEYLKIKNDRIRSLKNTISEVSTAQVHYTIYTKLFHEYRSYQSDSALVYAKKAVSTATLLTKKELHQSQFDLASILTTLGTFDQALAVLNNVESQIMPTEKGTFFWTKENVYGGLANYANNADEKEKYIQQSKLFRSKAIAHLPKNETLYSIALSGQLLNQKKYLQAYQLLFPVFNRTPKTDPNRAVIAYIISESFRYRKSEEEEKKWLTISAISDLELVKKENISLRKLAILLHEEGEIETAYEYTKRSLDDAVFCNSKLRTYEISKMLPIINESYEAKNKSNQSQLMVFLTSVSILSLFLIGVLILLFKQMKKLAKARKNVELANNQLSKLNQQLQGFNSKLNQTNLELAETSLLKEIYIGRYMDQCSIYIRKMEEYSQKLKVMATAGKVNDLVSTVKSKAFIDKELKEFYSQFDQTFVQLFPTFVEEFKTLLTEPETLVVKKGELLNPELRIFALIRLGIKDSAKIADFLRYSPSTIYNYRSQIKSKAKGIREEFEMKVMRIGTKSD